MIDATRYLPAIFPAERMRRRLLALLLLPLLLAACKSADELYNEGQDLELQGRYAEAVRHYAAALEKQPDLRKAQGRLLEAGRIAVERALARAAMAPPVPAADEYREVDDLLGRAERVGVALPVPEDYRARRRSAFDAAIEVLIGEGRERVRQGQFAEALDRYGRGARYEPSREQADALRFETGDAYAAWADADLAAGRYRDAYAHAEQGLAAAGPGYDAVAALQAAQAEALERGSLRTALLPLWQTPAAERALPTGFLEDLNDRLEDEHWRRPPLFVVPADPAALRRALRDYDLTRRLIRTTDAADVGRALDAHLVLTGEVERYERAATEKRRETKPVALRSGGRTTYQRVEDEVALTARVALEVVDPRRRIAVCDRVVERTAKDRIARGEYDGTIRLLDLSRSERALFDPEALQDAERTLEEDLLDALAAAVAEAAYDCIVGRVR